MERWLYTIILLTRVTGAVFEGCASYYDNYYVSRVLSHRRGLFWTHFRLGLATPFVNLDLCEERDRAKRLPRRLSGCKQNYSSGDFKQQGTSAYNGTTMYFQWTVSKTGKYLATVQFLLSPLQVKINHHMVYSSSQRMLSQEWAAIRTICVRW